MITRIELQNYESHKHTILDLSPSLNVLVGETDAGKSGFFRAIYWNIFNRPLGDEMLPKYWDGTTISKLTFSEEDSISRIKSKTRNDYQINDNKPINAGNGPAPEDIQAIIKMDEINFQTQIDRAFLMFDSPGERGRMLNSIAGLDDIDRSIDNSRSDELRLRKENSIIDSQLEEAIEEAKLYDDLEEREENLIIIEKLEEHANQATNRAIKITKIIDQLISFEAEINEAEKILVAESKLKEAKELSEKSIEREKKSNLLSRICRQINNIDDELSKIKDLEPAREKFNQVIKLDSQIELAEKKVKKIESILSQIIIINKQINMANKEVERIESELPEVCPTCNGKGYV